jgi:23S rRNA pseudouridine1911/1915/1917 synthase
MSEGKVTRRVVVPEELAGRRLDQAAAELIPEYSRTRLKAWMDGGQMTIGGQPAEAKRKVRGGEELVLEAELEPAVPLQPEPIPLRVVFEDESLLVIDKPAGLVVHPGAGNPAGTLQNALLHRHPGLAALPRAGLVHRLDKDTTGLLIIARTAAAQAALTGALERRQVARTYEGVCQGVLTGGGTVDAPIGRHPRDRLKMAVIERGRPARTRYRVLERFRAHTHVEVSLDTGRTHQIRVHMAHVGAPLVGDPVYGGRPRLPRHPSEALRARLQGFRRQALHARRLELEHPISGERLSFSSPLPQDLEALLAELRADLGSER